MEPPLLSNTFLTHPRMERAHLLNQKHLKVFSIRSVILEPPIRHLITMCQTCLPYFVIAEYTLCVCVLRSTVKAKKCYPQSWRFQHNWKASRIPLSYTWSHCILRYWNFPRHFYSQIFLRWIMLWHQWAFPRGTCECYSRDSIKRRLVCRKDSTTEDDRLRDRKKIIDIFLCASWDFPSGLWLSSVAVGGQLLLGEVLLSGQLCHGYH